MRRIVTACPHCFNTLRNEYPQVGGHYEVVHHTQVIAELIAAGRIRLQDGAALGELLRRNASRVLGLAFRYTGDRALAEARTVSKLRHAAVGVVVAVPPAASGGAA